MDKSSVGLQEKDKIIQHKEQELSRLMLDYYTFDMQSLKDEVERILTAEGDKVSKDREDKLKQIQNTFKRIMTLA